MTVYCNVNIYKRNATARNHTATHLLQKALRETLGSHVEQAGSKVNENMLRFDFTHFEPMTEEQIIKVENLVNQKITEFMPVVTTETSMDEAVKMGAMALFGEKYGNFVRVVNSGDWSIELCGGTHVANSGQIGALKIVSESGVASGVRRIEAVTGTGVLLKVRNAEDIINGVSDVLKTKPENLVNKAESTVEELKEAKKELTDIKKAELASDMGDLLADAKEINGIKLLTKEFKDCDINEMRDISDQIKSKDSKGIVMVFAANNDGKVTMMVSVTDDLLDKGYHG